MTTFRCDHALPGLLSAFLDVRQNWYPGEIDTLTGYEQAEYEVLQTGNERPSDEDVVLMLRQAANTLMGLPTSSDQACAEHIGNDWLPELRDFLDMTHDSGTLA